MRRIWKYLIYLAVRLWFKTDLTGSFWEGVWPPNRLKLGVHKATRVARRTATATKSLNIQQGNPVFASAFPKEGTCRTHRKIMQV